MKSLTVTREAAPGGVKVTNTGMRTDGSTINATYTAEYDGSSSEVTGERGRPMSSMSVKQGRCQLTFTYRSQGNSSKLNIAPADASSIAGDGKTMTLSSSGVDANGKPMTLKLVFEKQ